MTALKRLYKKYREIIHYLFWGGMTTLVSWASFSAVSWAAASLFRDTVTVLIANVVSWVCAVAFAFVTNKLWVFDSRDWSSRVVFSELVKFLSSRLVTGVLELAAVPFLVWAGLDQTIFGIEGIVAKILVSVVVIVLNYIFSKLFIFQDHTEG